MALVGPRAWARTMGALVRVSLMTAMQYRSDFLFETLTGFLRTAAVVAPLLLVFHHTDRLAGWTVEEAMLVMALFLLLSGLQGVLMEPNLGELVEAIRKGTLDLWLLKPADAQLLVSLRRVDPGQVWDLGAAALVAGWALWRLPPPAPLDVAVGAGLLLCGIAAMYGLWILAICTSFYFVRVDNLRFLLMSVTDAGRWPLGVFAVWLRWLLVLVVPVGLVTTFPADALRGNWTVGTLAVAVLVALLFLAGSRLAWNRSLASYTSASS